MSPSSQQSLLLCLTAVNTATAQYGGWNGGNGGSNYAGNPYSPGSPNSNNPGQSGNSFGPSSQSSQSSTSRQKILIAHGVLASLAFVLLFPAGSILLRLLPTRHAWLIHGIFQVFAYIIYIVAFGLGIWMVNNIPYNLLTTYHPIIGIVLLVLLFFQPVLGYVHHVRFKKDGRRTVWSYGHIWLGRIAITLGMVNGGLGLLLAEDAPAFVNFRPTRGQIVTYGVVAGIMWVLWVGAVVVGERRRAKGNVAAAKGEEGDGVSPPLYGTHKSRFA